MSEPAARIGVAPARREEWPAAVALVFGHLPEDMRRIRCDNMLALLAAGVLAADGVFLARQDGRLVGAMVGAALAGASGLFWLPQALPGPNAALVADALVQHGLAWLRTQGARIVQVFATADEMPYIGPLLRCGFRHITRLDYLIHDLRFIRAGSVSDGPVLRRQAYGPDTRQVFHDTLMRTYEGTLDCPELNGRRTVAEIIAGHEQQGHVRPGLWWLASADERPVGVALLTDTPGVESWELSYVGVVPEARRRGIGHALSLWALQEAKRAGVPQLKVSVDARNQPARQLYVKMGFVPHDQREVLLFFFADLADEDPGSPALVRS